MRNILNATYYAFLLASLVLVVLNFLSIITYETNIANITLSFALFFREFSTIPVNFGDEENKDL